MEQTYLNLELEQSISLRTLIDAWNKIVKDLPETHKLIDGPFVKGISSYGNPHLEYTIEIENPYFEDDKRYYDEQINAYLRECKAFDVEQGRKQEKREKQASSKALSLEDQIIWAETHLANLKAKKEEMLSC